MTEWLARPVEIFEAIDESEFLPEEYSGLFSATGG
jgi:hypothetical protein